MGVAAATSIGVGTMVGAGIFIFPGIAGGYAGPAAILSFLLGGLIAFIVASCTSELSTAMPRSGGGYFFVSKAFGPLFGCIIGVSQWLGLIFASAFYLMGFSDYFDQMLSNIGIESTVSPLFFAILPLVPLLIINIVGTKKVGRLQNTLVVVLTVVLLLLFSYGLFKIIYPSGEFKIFETFAPKGLSPILPTSALVFTSYLGFVQISTIAGEIKNPKRNLPKALMGSVFIVALLYVLVLFVTTSVLSVEDLKELGETAIVTVSKKILGPTGPLLVIVAGLLATLSSANASIISSSRSMYALAKDHLVPRKVGKISKRFKTPHYSLLLAVVPIFAMLFVKNLEFFAQVASVLHLIIYAGICAALVKFRKRPFSWYDPGYRAPKTILLPALGMLGCIFLLFSMDGSTIITGLSVALLAAFYYWVFIKNSQNKRAKQSKQPQQHNSTEDLHQ